jgi:hypothetical protein
VSVNPTKTGWPASLLLRRDLLQCDQLTARQLLLQYCAGHHCLGPCIQSVFLSDTGEGKKGGKEATCGKLTRNPQLAKEAPATQQLQQVSNIKQYPAPHSSCWHAVSNVLYAHVDGLRGWQVPPMLAAAGRFAPMSACWFPTDQQCCFVCAGLLAYLGNSGSFTSHQ